MFADIDPRTFNLDPASAAACIGPRTRAILIIHQLGVPADLVAFGALAKRHRLALVEDAACAAGSRVDVGRGLERIGRPHGVAATFSLHARKTFTTGEGGLITTSDDALSDRLRRLRNHGMSIPAYVRHATQDIVFESYLESTTNYRLSNIAGAIGRAQLTRLDDFVRRRHHRAAFYDRLLTHVPGLVVPFRPAGTKSNFQSYCIRLPEYCDQRTVLRRLLDEGIATRRGVMCAHREPAYASSPWRSAGKSVAASRRVASKLLHHSEQATDHCILIPLFPALRRREQERVAECVVRAIR